MLRLSGFCRSKEFCSVGYGSIGCDDINDWSFGGSDDKWSVWVPDDQWLILFPAIYWIILG